METLFGGFMPGFILSICPYMLSLLLGDSSLFWFSLIHASTAGGDWLVVWIIRNVQGGMQAEDHPTFCLSFNVRELAHASWIKQSAEIAARSPVAGIGVGMTPDYGAAQRLYILRGYVPDGRGLHYRGHHIQYGEQITIDDSLALYLTKELK